MLHACTRSHQGRVSFDLCLFRMKSFRDSSGTGRAAKETANICTVHIFAVSFAALPVPEDPLPIFMILVEHFSLPPALG